MRTKCKLAIVSVMACLFLLLIGKSFTVMAAETQEISTNTTVTGFATNDEIWYAFTTTNYGYFTYEVKNHDIQNKITLQAILKDSNGNELVNYYGENIYSPTWPCVPNTTYYVVVKSYISKKYGEYDLLINEVADASWEHENNNSQLLATPLELNTTVNGVLSGKTDVDWYTATVSDTGKFNFEIAHKDISETDRFSVEMYLEDGTQLYYSYGKGWVSRYKGFKPGTVIYIKVYAYDSNAAYDIYQLSLNFEKDEHFESEDNDSQSTANKISLDKTYQGIVDSYDDSADYFLFKVNNNSLVTLTFGPVDFSNAGTWDVYVVNKSGVEQKVCSTKTTNDYSFYLKKGTYYLKIVCGSNAKNLLYTFKLSAKKAPINGKTTIKSVTYEKSYYLFAGWATIFEQIELSKKAKNATTYEYRVSTNSKMKKSTILLTRDSSLNGDTLFTAGKSDDAVTYIKNQTYYIQVRPYIQDLFGNRWYGKKSNIKKFTVTL